MHLLDLALLTLAVCLGHFLSRSLRWPREKREDAERENAAKQMATLQRIFAQSSFGKKQKLNDEEIEASILEHAAQIEHAAEEERARHRILQRLVAEGRIAPDSPLAQSSSILSLPALIPEPKRHLQ